MEKVIDTNNLTPREQEILNFLLEGISTKEIAFRLNLSPRTVDFHRNKINKKLGVSNLQDLIERALLLKNKQNESESSANQQVLKTKNPFKFLIPAAIFVLFCLVIPLWYLIIKTPSIKNLDETPTEPFFIDHTYDIVYLRANRYSNSEDGFYGQGYVSYDDIKLKHFYSGTLDDLLPESFDWYTLRISGTAEIELKNVKLNFALIPYGGSEWLYLGGGEFNYADVGPGYFSIEIKVHKNFNNLSDLPAGEVVIQLVMDLFQLNHKNPANNFDTGIRLPDDVPNNTIMTTVRNFKIEPVFIPEN